MIHIYIKEILQEIDSCDNPADLDQMKTFWSDNYLVGLFWKCKSIFFDKESTELDRKKAMTKASYINFCYSAQIPINRRINRFKAPHGFRGIFISASASIGIGCTIFHHVTIGSNTLLDSKNAGSPTIGNNVYIGAGAKIIGNVKIGNNVRIGAGCFVAEDIEDNTVVIQARASKIHRVKKLDNRFFRIAEFNQIKKSQHADQNSELI